MNQTNYIIDVQYATQSHDMPDEKTLTTWASDTLRVVGKLAGELSIRVVDSHEIQALNKQYRHKDKPTNVLSFPAQLPEGIALDVPMFGDIVICAEVVNEEARVQNKLSSAHWAHMIVHGVLHLLGFDHDNDAVACVMEAKEIEILQSLGFENPYEVNDVR